MLIYISGAIAGEPDYKTRFVAAEAMLQERGHDVINPARLPEGMTKAEYMTLNFADINRADAVYFLRNAHKSAGARLEYDYAVYVGKLRFLESLGEMPG